MLGGLTIEVCGASVAAKAGDVLVVIGKHAELRVGVVEHLLIARPVEAKQRAVSGCGAALCDGALHSSPTIGLAAIADDNRVDLFCTF